MFANNIRSLQPSDMSKQVDDGSKLNLSLQDVICPICYLIMIEPVVMPCKHSLCMPCFQENVTKTAMACPFCKKRISNWLRNATKKNILVHKELWEWIQENFKNKVERRCSGIDEPTDDFVLSSPLRISSPGEIREEFAAQIKKLEEEENSRREKEERESMILISKIQDEDKQSLRSSTSSPSSAFSPQVYAKINQNSSKKMKRASSLTRSLATPKQLSLDSFLKNSSPKSSKPGKIFSQRKLIDMTNISCNSDSENTPEEKVTQDTHSSPPILGIIDQEIDFVDELKLQDFNDNSMSQNEYLKKLIEEQKLLEDRLKQEKEDERLAIQLQKEIKNVNRSKGSEDEYCLRKRISDYLQPLSNKNLPNKRDRSPSTSKYEPLSKAPRID